ncbi:MAG: hypothetical protein ACREFQ_04760 [Stellaceae bacterium]
MSIGAGAPHKGWRRIALLVIPMILGLGMAGQPAAAAGVPLDKYVPAPPEPGTAIPTATIKFGMRPYADNTFYVIGMKKGWFKEVGISFSPSPYGLQANDTDVTTLLLNGQLDIISEFCPLMLPTYKSAKTLKCLAFTDNFLGNAILANPKLHLKSFKDYIKEGKNFQQALHAAMAPLDGKTLVGAPELSDRPFEEEVEKLAKVHWNLQVLDDSKSLVLAKAGREDFVNPEGAPIVYTLRQAGWTDLIDVGDLYKYGPSGPNSPIESLVGIVGVGANGTYANTHQNTVLRFLSVVWRIIDEVKADPSLYDLQAPYLNSFAGTSLNGKGVQNTIEVLDPLSPFDYDKIYYDEPNNVLYYRNVYNAWIDNFEKHGIVPKGTVTSDYFVWGAVIWHQMVDYRNKTDAMIKKLEKKHVTGDKEVLLAKAKQFYGWYDYLDAYRLALAASH